MKRPTYSDSSKVNARSEPSSQSPIAKNKQSQVFRPIHYLGSKLRLLDELDEYVAKVAPDSTTFCDLFAGSGTVSKHFIRSHNVVSIDIQEYSRVISSAISAPSNSLNHSSAKFVLDCKKSNIYNQLIESTVKLREFETSAIANAESGDLEDACSLLEDGCFEFFRLNATKPKDVRLAQALEESYKQLNSLELLDSKSSMVFRYFGGIYFSYEQSCAIDSILEAIHALPECDRSTFLAALLSSTSEIVNTVGKQFAQPIKPRDSNGFPKKALKTQLKKDRYLDTFSIFEKWLTKYINLPTAHHRHVSVKSDYAEFLFQTTEKIDVFYADPPYTRDHYSRYYHILESICLRDNPEISKVKTNGKVSLSRGIYREDRHQSPFCIKSQALNAFERLFEGVKRHDAPLIISYSPFAKESNNRPRVLSIVDIVALAENYFESVEVVQVGNFSHSKLNHTAKNTETISEAENLIICRLK